MSKELVFNALGQLLQDQVGFRLFTITRVVPGTQEVERIYTTDPATYPVTGRKPILPDAWTEQVLIQRQPFLARQAADFKPYFPDHDKLVQMGLGCVINFPVSSEQGELLGTINLLDAPGQYQDDTVARCAALQSEVRQAFAHFNTAHP
ncbi:hypothetical protein [Leeia sp.]|uniref:hypothetical protein n=1 Tax=Leeia sp. TaxID=2884678 RepID=UPI0035B1E26E